jgi:serpin B
MRRLPVLLLAASLVIGCSGASPSAVTTDGITLAEAHVPRLAASDADAKSAGSAVNAFGLALYAKARSGNGNIVISPASIAVALSMARAGARGTTATEMDAVLRDLGTDAHAGWIASLDQALSARTGTFSDPGRDPQQVTLRIVNAPFVQRGMTLAPAYLDALSARFGAGVRLVDYVKASEAARMAINAWVADQTEQRIKELLAKGTIDGQTRLALVNAIYLKAPWLHQFEIEATASAPFQRPDGSAVQVPMMRTGEKLPYAAGTGWRAVELPYAGGQLAMDVILPDDLPTFEATFDAAKLDDITGVLAERLVTLGLPRFSAESSLSLGDTLAAMGMPTAFTDRADFSGITTDEALAISAVIHQANIDVDENGTTAAAATVVAIAASGMPLDQVTLTIDRPFLFALRDLDTGAVLFLGRIADPSAQQR